MRNINKNIFLKCLFILALLYNDIIIIIITAKIESTNREIFSLNNRYKYEITQKKKDIRKYLLSNEVIKIFSELYEYSIQRYSKPKIINSSLDYLPKYKKSKICICSIGKNENLYAKEFVEHYKSIGIDKIFIYDNNDIQGESFETILSDYIKNT